MIVTVDISMYPLHVNFRELVQDFIAKLESYQHLRVHPGPTSTVIIGEYASVMEAITELLAWSHSEHGQAVFVTKFILDYEAV
ncbi:MAG: thiamine-binding protein [Halioglobus sp.]|nr:thiamine-binding protein [Halioglobus sp.]